MTADQAKNKIENTQTSISLRADLNSILERIDRHDAAIRRSRSIDDREEQEAARRDAEGEYWAATQALADLTLLLIRQTNRHRRVELAVYMADIISSDPGAVGVLFEAMAQRIGELVGRILATPDEGGE